MRPVPVIFRWVDVDVVDADGVVRTRPAMVPMHRFDKVCARQFELNESYMLAPEDGHESDKSRRHYFACLRSAWQNLPEAIAHRYPSIEHMRKAALVKAGFRNERHHPCASYEEALHLAAIFKDVDEFCITVIHQATNVLSVYTAKSQSRFGMKAPEFQASKVAVLDLVAGLIGVTAEELGRRAQPEDRPPVERNPDHSLEREPAGKALEGPPARPALPPPAGGERATASQAVGAGPKSEDRA